MAQPIVTTPQTDPFDGPDDGTGGAWAVTLAAAREAERLADSGETATFAIEPGDFSAEAKRRPGELKRVSDGHPDAALIWHPGVGWELALAADDPRTALIDLYLPICSATKAHPITVGHLGQSLDGFIATHAGDSQYVTGQENILHLHRMRALSDAIVVGAGTVAADDPQLTTRRVSGPSPLRVVLDPMRRLGEHYKVFRDNLAETLYVCGRSVVGADETHFGRATVVAVADTPNGLDVGEVTRLLRARGCHRIFVEGGGVTVSMFLEANLLDRLQVAIAPLIIGNGRPAIRLPPRAALSDCRRPAYRVFRMGGDVFFDCELKDRLVDATEPPSEERSLVSRVI
jgi:diaminohydroxyphosphoribosylaminopyrimidine deaminase / 5-amino-6-(5-phosphoribosylamino)uracil reductase